MSLDYVGYRRKFTPSIAGTVFTFFHGFSTTEIAITVLALDDDGVTWEPFGDFLYDAEPLDGNTVQITFYENAAGVAGGDVIPGTIEVFVTSLAVAPDDFTAPVANPFFTALNSVTPAIAAMCAESFVVVRNGVAGSWSAVSIDEIEAGSPEAMPGGRFEGVSVRVWLTKATLLAAGIVAETVLSVRGVQVRVKNDPVASDDGGDMVAVECGPVGVKWK